MAGKVKQSYKCSECGNVTARWFGRCPECQSWGTLEESGGGSAALRSLTAGAVSAPAKPIRQVDVEAARARPTGVSELDRVLGGGLVPGSVVLLAGEPGVGKSTLLLEVASKFADADRKALIVTGEESASQVRLRAERTGALAPSLYLASETDLSALIGHVDAVRPGLLVVDSVQTLASPTVDGSAGGITQVRAVAAAVIALAKERGIAAVLVGHVTKDGSIAGPRMLEHLVDVVLHFEGDRHSTLRMVRAIKNRYGAADEVGCFEMVDDGIRGLADPSGLFISDRKDTVEGTCITIAVEGRRPIPTEVQALTNPSQIPSPRRSVSGLDSSRVAMSLAVLARSGYPLGDRDVFVATVGGVKVTEPAADLAIALALASDLRSKPLPPSLVAFGEVSLAGDIRRVTGVSRRLTEAARMGFKTAIVPPGTGKAPAGLRVVEVRSLREALLAAGLPARPGAGAGSATG
ncbi:DNA repair protein RadA [Blastococcus sp. Marseille-P5729]|uniref:DNA repair protein RadA n=1 Tax=Blastococcus sp. Marseille-P5729 TaxID=2086582 RepID=UPI000D0ECD39|nr:DNA repair protein RadA [Blastococcus sp. Marseille-P5729]